VSVTESQSESHTYDFGVPPVRGLFLGLSLKRLLVVGGGLLLMTIALVARVPVPIALLPFLSGVAVAFVKVQGRRVDEWAPVVLSYLRAGAEGRRSWLRGMPSALLARPGRPPDPVRSTAERHPLLAEATFTETKVAGMAIGVCVTQAKSRLLSAVFSVTGNACFALLPHSEQAMAISQWGEVLAESCVNSKHVHALQWVQRSVPDLAAEAETWMRQHLSPLRTGTKAFEDYADLIDRLDEVASTHEVYLVAQIRSKAADLDESLEEAVLEWSAISSRLAGIGLSPRPLARAELTGLLGAYADGVGFAGAQKTPDAMPMAFDEHWDHIRVDGLCHRVFAVSAWPRIRVWPSWLEPLLIGGSAGNLRTVSVHMHPVSHDTARRRARAAVAATSLDEESRRRAGFVIGAQHRREASDAEQREAELVAGYGEHSLGALCMVSAPSLELLEAASRALVQGSVQSSLDLRVLYGAQRAGYVGALPLAQLRFNRTLL
jgi:hypothetical protein